LTFAKENNLDFCEVSAATSENVEVAMRRLIVSVGNSLIEQDSRLSLPNLEVNSSLLLDLDGGSGDVSLPRPTLSKLPKGWVEVKSGIYENVWTGDRETARPKVRVVVVVAMFFFFLLRLLTSHHTIHIINNVRNRTRQVKGRLITLGLSLN
jgi:hypothetical protein